MNEFSQTLDVITNFVKYDRDAFQNEFTMIEIYLKPRLKVHKF